jgi:hypothetical protein
MRAINPELFAEVALKEANALLVKAIEGAKAAGIECAAERVLRQAPVALLVTCAEAAQPT